MACLLSLGLGACAGGPEARQGEIGYVEGFYGAVATDEPRAALVGRDVLSAGGSAADAAVAVYFALAVTLPSSASLGGGGVCAVHDHPRATTEALDFIAPAPKVLAPGTTRPVAVPANARGFFALHAKYGRMRFPQLVAPAETLARFKGHVSRAFAQDLKRVAPALLEDPAANRVFAKAGRPVDEGDFIEQHDLAAVLGQIRRHGPGVLYTGRLARLFVDAAQQAGGGLTMADLRDYRPRWTETVRIGLGHDTVHAPPPPAAAGVVGLQMLSLLDRWDFADAEPPLRAHMLAEAATRAFAERAEWLAPDGMALNAGETLVGSARLDSLAQDFAPQAHTPAKSLNPDLRLRQENPAATAFVVVDNQGSAVACSLTLNNLFGTGRVAPGTGILLAALPGANGRGPMSLGPMLVVNHNVNELKFAGAASGGVAAPTALVNVMAPVMLGNEQLAHAIARPRVHHGGAPDFTFHEPTLDEDTIAALDAREHETVATPVLGLVNAVSCPGGLPPRPESCRVSADPRGFGLAAAQ